MTKTEDDQNGQNGKLPKWKMTQIEDDQNRTRPK